jgi:hypothetical protein
MGHRHVRNPHFVGTVKMHLEEIVAQLEREDTTAAMMRFLVCRFPSVVNKILPACEEAEMRQLLEADPDYFNDLAYDDVVESVAHILLVSKDPRTFAPPPS